MKNVAKKSSTRPAGDCVRRRMAPSAPPKESDVQSAPRSSPVKHRSVEDTPILEKFALGINGQSRHLVDRAASSLLIPKDSSVSNGTGSSATKKRPPESESDTDNPAKLARTQIAHLHRKQEEMLATAIGGERTDVSSDKNETKKCARSNTKGSNIPNSLLKDSGSNHASSSESEANIEPDSSADSNPKRSLFSIGAKMKDSFKGIQAAVTNIALDTKPAVIEQSSVSLSDSDLEMSKPDHVSSTTVRATASSEARAPGAGKSNLFESLSDLSPFGPLVSHFSAGSKKAKLINLHTRKDHGSGK